MRFGTQVRSWVDSVEYWTKYALLSVYGPAAQDRRSDPIERLKRQYGRPPSV